MTVPVESLWMMEYAGGGGKAWIVLVMRVAVRIGYELGLQR